MCGSICHASFNPFNHTFLFLTATCELESYSELWISHGISQLRSISVVETVILRAESYEKDEFPVCNTPFDKERACLKIMDLPNEMREPKWYPIIM